MSDHRFFDRVWFGGHSTTGTHFLAGMGAYKNTNILDGFFTVLHEGTQRNIRVPRPFLDDPASMAAGPVSIEIVKPYEQMRLTAREQAGKPFSAELLFTAIVPVSLEAPHCSRAAKGQRCSCADHPATDRTSVAHEGRLAAVRAEQWDRLSDSRAQVRAPVTAGRLQDYWRKRFPDRPHATITSLKELSGGFSKTTVLFEVTGWEPELNGAGLSERKREIAPAHVDHDRCDGSAF